VLDIIEMYRINGYRIIWYPFLYNNYQEEK